MTQRQTTHVTQRLNTPLAEHERDEVTKDFIEYAAIQDFNLENWKANKVTVKAFVDQLGLWSPYWAGIVDFSAVYNSGVFKSLVIRLRNVTGARAHVIKDRVDARKVAL